MTHACTTSTGVSSAVSSVASSTGVSSGASSGFVTHFSILASSFATRSSDVGSSDIGHDHVKGMFNEFISLSLKAKEKRIRGQSHIYLFSCCSSLSKIPLFTMKTVVALLF